MANYLRSLRFILFVILLASISIVLNTAEARSLGILKLQDSITADVRKNEWTYSLDQFTIGAVKDGPAPGIGHKFTYGDIKDSGPSPGEGHR
nr:precursor of CEP16-like [Ipomoea batatas]GMD56795.1 precursor of CEP16-like [Ipomoea batatas]